MSSQTYISLNWPNSTSTTTRSTPSRGSLGLGFHFLGVSQYVKWLLFSPEQAEHNSWFSEEFMAFPLVFVFPYFFGEVENNDIVDGYHMVEMQGK